MFSSFITDIYFKAVVSAILRECTIQFTKQTDFFLFQKFHIHVPERSQNVTTGLGESVHAQVQKLISMNDLRSEEAVNMSLV